VVRKSAALYTNLINLIDLDNKVNKMRLIVIEIRQSFNAASYIYAS